MAEINIFIDDYQVKISKVIKLERLKKPPYQFLCPVCKRILQRKSGTYNCRIHGDFSHKFF